MIVIIKIQEIQQNMKDGNASTIVIYIITKEQLRL